MDVEKLHVLLLSLNFPLHQKTRTSETIESNLIGLKPQRNNFKKYSMKL
jgi:hypothetical protein